MDFKFIDDFPHFLSKYLENLYLIKEFFLFYFVAQICIAVRLIWIENVRNLECPCNFPKLTDLVCMLEGVNYIDKGTSLNDVRF